MSSASDSLKEAVSHLKGFVMPVQPELLGDLRQAFPDTELMADLLLEDPSLCLSVLRLSSVSEENLHNRSSIRSAIDELGAEKITAMINAVLFIMARKDEFHSVSFEDYWETSKKVTGFITELTRQLNIPLVEEAQCVGVLHNIGMPFLWQKHPDYFDLIQSHNDRNLVVVENELFKCDHATIGFYVAKGLHLNNTVCDVIRYHHMADQFFAEESTMDPDTQILLALLKMTESIIDESGVLTLKSDLSEWEQIKLPVLDLLGLSEPDYDDLADMIK
ncbi:HDOD domain-containing protein [Litoribrevibacter euphylliae]|uniref:HDOD domain-containing protein n=1 Tax=Litoribrevibacter euphylliae TaxID=1834034 RepID=A0ABV7HJ18_9GAMM